MDSNNFFHWLATNYPQLHQRLTDTDSLHDACITVYKLRNIIPDEYLTSILRAYQLHRKRYAQYIFRFIVPDPRFWLFREEMPEDMFNELISYDKMTQQQELKDMQEEQRRAASMENFRKFVKKHYTDADAMLVNMFYIQHLSFKDISRLTSMPVNKVKQNIETILTHYRTAKNSERGLSSTRKRKPIQVKQKYKQLSICFYIGPKNGGLVRVGNYVIEQLGLKEGSKLFFQQTSERFYLSISVSILDEIDYRPYTLLLRKDGHSLLGNNKHLVHEILRNVGARKSATLLIRPTGNPNIFRLEMNKSIRID